MSCNRCALCIRRKWQTSRCRVRRHKPNHRPCRLHKPCALSLLHLVTTKDRWATPQSPIPPPPAIRSPVVSSLTRETSQTKDIYGPKQAAHRYQANLYVPFSNRNNYSLKVPFLPHFFFVSHRSAIADRPCLAVLASTAALGFSAVPVSSVALVTFAVLAPSVVRAPVVVHLPSRTPAPLRQMLPARTFHPPISLPKTAAHQPDRHTAPDIQRILVTLQPSPVAWSVGRCDSLQTPDLYRCVSPVHRISHTF